MPDRRAGWAACAALALGGCGDAPSGADEASVAANFRPPAARPVAPARGLAQTVPLRDYIGWRPREALGGVTFHDRTEVATALDEAVGDEALRRLVVVDDRVGKPVFAMGERVAVHGCRTTDCAGENWTLIVDPRGGRGELCHQTPAMRGGSRWYAGAAPTTRSGGCPVGDVPDAKGAI